MRKIKFRAWLPLRKKMEYEKIDAPYIYNNLNLLLKNLIIPNTDGEIWCILMQFTDLKDKNGKEIYEGDIIQYQENEYKENHLVEFRRGCFGLKDNQDLWELDLDTMWGIIGNIYENPEILK